MTPFPWNSQKYMIWLLCGFLSILKWTTSMENLADLQTDTVNSVYPFFGPRLSRFEFINYTKYSNEDKTIQYTIIMRPKLTWIEASVSCACHCGTLVDILDEKELDLVNKMITDHQKDPYDICDSRNHQVWVGALSLNRPYHRYHWYATDKLVDAFVWGKGKPENHEYKGQVWPPNCGAMKHEYFQTKVNRTYMMNDEPCNWQQFPYICKWTHQSDIHDRERKRRDTVATWSNFLKSNRTAF